MAPSPPRQQIIEALYGQPDQVIVDALPDLDLRALVDPEPSVMLPTIHFGSKPDATRPGRPDPAAAALDASLAHDMLPDALLLWSGDWYGPKLRRVAQALVPALSADQLRVLEVMAVARSVNARLLLVIAQVKGAPAAYPTRQAWLKWLYLETSRVRAALGPFAPSTTETVAFRDGAALTVAPAVVPPASWALLTIFAAGRSAPETTAALDTFSAAYTRAFGAPSLDAAQPVAVAPFLHKPYVGALNGRSYYDHTYPSIDNGSSPNITGMLDYLGRSNTTYDTHDADDLWMPYGSSVFAPVSGTILWTDDQGLLIRPGGTTYDIVIYHLSARYVEVGAVVTTGQLIARSGRAGGIEHIHFEVRHNGKQTDTMGWYGGGSDPCPYGPGGIGRYNGCEPSVWLWADEPPPSDDTTPPTGPINVHVKATTDDSITLAWQNQSSNLDGSNIYAGVWNGSAWTFYYSGRADAGATTFVDTPLSCGADYYYQVRAYNGAGEASGADPVHGVTLPCGQPPPQTPWVYFPLIQR